MAPRSFYLLMAVALLVGCATQPASLEVLDETSAMTAGVLAEPIAFTETGIYDLLDPNPKQASVAYVGPVEWDRSGELTYVLWIQLAPGVGGHPLDDLRARGAVALQLDSGPVSLRVTDFANVTSTPYHLVEPVGQSAYFSIGVENLKKMANSRKVVLKLRAADLSEITFVPSVQPQAAIKRFIVDREIAAN